MEGTRREAGRGRVPSANYNAGVSGAVVAHHVFATASGAKILSLAYCARAERNTQRPREKRKDSPHASARLTAGDEANREGHSQFSCHDHLGLVRVDRAALLEQVNCCFVAIYKQQALPEDVEVDQLACAISIKSTSTRRAHACKISPRHIPKSKRQNAKRATQERNASTDRVPWPICEPQTIVR